MYIDIEDSAAKNIPKAQNNSCGYGFIEIKLY